VRKKIDFATTNLVQYSFRMSATEVIEQFEALPACERAQQGMADVETGRFVDLDTALNEPYPGDQ
jgi:predicted transcriptional regulator